MREWGWKHRDERMVTGGQHRQGMQHCASLGCLHPQKLRFTGARPSRYLGSSGVCMRAAHRTGDISSQQKHWDTHTQTQRAQCPASPAGYFSMVIAPETT